MWQNIIRKRWDQERISSWVCKKKYRGIESKIWGLIDKKIWLLLDLHTKKLVKKGFELFLFLFSPSSSPFSFSFFLNYYIQKSLGGTEKLRVKMVSLGQGCQISELLRPCKCYVSSILPSSKWECISQFSCFVALPCTWVCLGRLLVFLVLRSPHHKSTITEPDEENWISSGEFGFWAGCVYWVGFWAVLFGDGVSIVHTKEK